MDRDRPRGDNNRVLILALLGVFLLVLIGSTVIFVLLQPRANVTTATGGNPTAISEPTRTGPLAGNAGDVVRDYYNNLRSNSFPEAFTLLSPNAQSRVGDINKLETQWHQQLDARGASFQAVTIDDVSEQGDSAVVKATLLYTSGFASQVEHRLVRSENRWLVDS
jgi:hypothetical protein